MTICSVYPIEKYNRGMGGNSNYVRIMPPTYRGCTVLCNIPTPKQSKSARKYKIASLK